jgi:hypothetical protein
MADTLNDPASKNEIEEMRTMRKLHKGLIIGGATLAVLVPAGLVAADQIDMGNGPGHGRGNGTMTHDCTRSDSGTPIQARDGTGPNHAANMAKRSGTTTTSGTTTQRQYGPMNGTGGQMRRGG